MNSAAVFLGVLLAMAALIIAAGELYGNRGFWLAIAFFAACCLIWLVLSSLLTRRRRS